MNRFFFITLLLFSIGRALLVKAQQPSIPSQRIVIKDNILYRNLTTFTQLNWDKVLSITIRLRDSATVYTLEGSCQYAYHGLDTNQLAAWGFWKNRVILFYTTVDITPICTVSNSTTYMELLTYLRSLFPTRKPLVATNGLIYSNVEPTPCTSHKWIFWVHDGNEIWFWDSLSPDTSDIVELN